MNWKIWKEISEKYPKGFLFLNLWLAGITDPIEDDKELFTYEYFIQEYLTAWEDYPWNWRNLYDFFDKNEIWIQIALFEDSDDIGLMWFQAEINYKPNGAYLDRQEAEKAAFMKAFEVLEEKLKQ